MLKSYGWWCWWPIRLYCQPQSPGLGIWDLGTSDIMSTLSQLGNPKDAIASKKYWATSQFQIFFYFQNSVNSAFKERVEKGYLSNILQIRAKSEFFSKDGDIHHFNDRE